jgi:hypothetical protein
MKEKERLLQIKNGVNKTAASIHTTTTATAAEEQNKEKQLSTFEMEKLRHKRLIEEGKTKLYLLKRKQKEEEELKKMEEERLILQREIELEVQLMNGNTTSSSSFATAIQKKEENGLENVPNTLASPLILTIPNDQLMTKKDFETLLTTNNTPSELQGMEIGLKYWENMTSTEKFLSLNFNEADSKKIFLKEDKKTRKLKSNKYNNSINSNTNRQDDDNRNEWKDLLYLEKLRYMYHDEPLKCEFILNLPLYRGTLIRDTVISIGINKIMKKRKKKMKRSRKKSIAILTSNNSSDNVKRWNKEYGGNGVNKNVLITDNGYQRIEELNNLFNSIHFGEPITFNEMRKIMLL